jgi:hypothetical protein
VGPRDLLTDHERTLLFEIPADDHELIRHYTLSRADQEFVLAKRVAGCRIAARVASSSRLRMKAGSAGPRNVDESALVCASNRRQGGRVRPSKGSLPAQPSQIPCKQGDDLANGVRR